MNSTRNHSDGSTPTPSPPLADSSSQLLTPRVSPSQFKGPLRRAFQCINALYNGDCEDTHYFDVNGDFQVLLTDAEYKNLTSAIDDDKLLRAFVDDKVHDEWFPSAKPSGKGQFRIRMTTALHAIVASRLRHAIEDWLEQLKHAEDRSEKVRNAAGKIQELPNGEIYFSKSAIKFSKVVPDLLSMFSIEEADAFAAFALEVGFSQTEEDVQTKALAHVISGQGHVRTSLAIKLEYKTPGGRKNNESISASYVIIRWDDREVSTGRFPGEIVDFRDTDGRVIEGSLTLRLSDFCPADQIDPSNDELVEISHAKLSSFVEMGIKAQLKKDALILAAKTAPAPPKGQGNLKRRNPPEKSDVADASDQRGR